MRILKRAIVIVLSLLMVCINVVHVDAKAISPRSGGLVSSSQTVKSCKLKRTYWKYTDLVDDWAKTSQYTVKKNVTVSTSCTISCGLTASAQKELSAKMGITYGISVSTSSSIGRTIPADSSRNSKLRHKVQMKEFDVTVTITSKYYDTSLGYYTLSNNYSGVVTVPNKNESYIEVYYK